MINFVEHLKDPVFNNILRLYFNQIDNTLRDTSLADRSDAVGWFVG